MSDLLDPNDKPADDMESVSEAEQAAYQQPHADAAKTTIPTWLIPALFVVLVFGVLLGRYWASSQMASNTPLISTTDPQHQAAASNAEAAVLTVETVMPRYDTVDETLRREGTIRPKDTANVSAKVSGVAIEQVLAEEGQSVKAGQVLAIFDTDAVEQQILQAKADVAEAKATLANARADAARVLPLLDIDAISRQEADRYRTSELRADAALQAAKARLSNQKLNRNNAQVVAPVSGIISDKMAEVGMVSGGEPLFTIIKDGVLEWQADIDPKLVDKVSVGTAVKVSLPNNQSVMGKVSRIAPTADNNRQITIYARLNKDPAARSGMYQTGEFLLGSTRIQTLPNAAIVSSDGYDYVMLVKDIRIESRSDAQFGHIERQRMTLGERLGDDVAVIEPLADDSRLVKQGGSFLNDGDLVRVVATEHQDTKASATAQARS